MQKKQSIIIAAITAIVMLFLALFIMSSIKEVNRNVSQSCFDELVITSEHLTEDFKKTVNIDREILTAMSAIIEKETDMNTAEMCEVLKLYNNEYSYVSYVELLRPNNMMLNEDGSERDVSGILDFSDEARMGAHISGIAPSTHDPNEKVIRNAVPIKRNGKTIYMLYGSVSLSELAQKYKTNIYDGHAYVYLLDSSSGDFILDTWHKSLGNISELGERKAAPGYSFDNALINIKNGIEGDAAFISKTTGKLIYMHYEPVGVNNWTVMLTVEKKYALKESENISSVLFKMAFVVGTIGLLYMISVLLILVKAYSHVRKLGMEDRITGLQNRNSYDAFYMKSQDKTFEMITCIYIDANGLHEVNNKFGHHVGDQMLQIIADELKKEFRDEEIYRIGGDEFVVFCESETYDSCIEKMQKVCSQIEMHDYNVSYGIVSRKDERGINRVTQEADEKMLKNKKEFYANSDNRQRGE